MISTFRIEMNSQRSCGCLVRRSWEEKGSLEPKEGLLSDTAVRGGERKGSQEQGEEGAHTHIFSENCVLRGGVSGKMGHGWRITLTVVIPSSVSLPEASQASGVLQEIATSERRRERYPQGS